MKKKKDLSLCQKKAAQRKRMTYLRTRKPLPRKKKN